MKLLPEIFFSPIVIAVVGIAAILVFWFSPYEISFEDKDETEI